MVVQELEAAARRRYLAAGDLAFVAAAPPLAAERIRDGELTIAEHEGQQRGFVVLHVVDDLLHVTNVSVDPAHSGRGIGEALIRHSIRSASARGLQAVTLTTFRAPAWNAPWFARLGFEPMPPEAIGPALRRTQQWQAKSVDPATRVTLWHRLGAAGDDLLIRPYRSDDLDAAIAIFLASIREIASKDYDPSQIEAWAQVDRDAWSARRLDRPTWVALVRLSPAGFIDLKPNGHVDMLFVHPAHRRTGAAGALLRHAIRAARHEGLRRMFTEASITARPVFERHGFEVIAEQLGEVRGQRLTNFRMEKQLP